MIGFLTFLLFLAGSVILFTYISWRLNGRRDGEFKIFLRNRYEAYREQRAERSDLAAGNLKIIRSKELPEAPPRTPGDHDGMEVNENDRDSEIQRLNKLFGDS